MKKFCESLREQEKNIIDFGKKKMLTLTKKELKSHQDATECYICWTKFVKTLETFAIIQANIEGQHILFVI